MRPLPRSFFAGDAVDLAPKLLGKVVKKGSCAGVIVETEAYTTDPASHAYKLTPRSQIMRDTYGHWYVYFTYGMHWCANVTTNQGGIGAVLIRAVEPVEGLALMKRRRQKTGMLNIPKVGMFNIPVRELCNGPAKFCRAFGISGEANGAPVAGSFAIFDAPDVAPESIGTSGRIGIKDGTELPWRFFIRDNPFVSRHR
jgi:DNA-3-methyladenine glycosylase